MLTYWTNAQTILIEVFSMSLLDNALDLIAKGLSPLPIGFKQKKPSILDWPNADISKETAPRHFNCGPQNVGVKLGGRSGITDVDNDCAEAIAVARYFLPETNARFGRPSRRCSHYLYTTALVNEGVT